MLRTFVPLIALLSLYDFCIAQEEGITFAEHIAPIVYEHCTPCHRRGGIGPMSLKTYEEVASYGAMIKYVTSVGYMPPWPADPGYRHFRHENALSDREVEVIRTWVDAGLHRGSEEAIPKPPVFRDHPGIKHPDLEYSMSRTFEQYGVYADQYMVFVLPTDLKEDRYVRAVEFIPGNREIVRGCMVSIDRSGRYRKWEEWDPRYGYFSFGGPAFVPEYSLWYNWSPGDGALHFPEGYGKRLPAGSNIILHIHYGPIGQRQPDSSSIRFELSGEKPKKMLRSAPLVNPYILTNPPFVIPANEVKRFHAELKLPFDIEIHALMPQSQLLGKRWELFAQRPGERIPVKLLRIDDWDFNWKRTYYPDTPIHLPAGTELHALAEYDNTTDNPLNPSRNPGEMRWGKHMFSELFLVHVQYTHPPDPDRASLPVLFQELPVNTIRVETKIEIEVLEERTLTAELIQVGGDSRKTLVHEKAFVRGKHELNLNFKGLPHGLYIIELRNPHTDRAAREFIVYWEEGMM